MTIFLHKTIKILILRRLNTLSQVIIRISGRTLRIQRIICFDATSASAFAIAYWLDLVTSWLVVSYGRRNRRKFYLKGNKKTQHNCRLYHSLYTPLNSLHLIHFVHLRYCSTDIIKEKHTCSFSHSTDCITVMLAQFCTSICILNFLCSHSFTWLCGVVIPMRRRSIRNSTLQPVVHLEFSLAVSKLYSSFINFLGFLFFFIHFSYSQRVCSFPRVSTKHW